MIGRFSEKVRKSRRPRVLGDPEKCSGARARLAELAERRTRYLRAIENGDRAFPASERVLRNQKHSSVREIWEDTRLEALNYLWSFGSEPPQILADARKQDDLLFTYFSLKLSMYFNVKMPEKIPDGSIDQMLYATWLAVFNAYSHLEDLGWAGYSPEDPERQLHVLEDLNGAIHKLQKARLDYGANIRNFFFRKTNCVILFDIIYADITAKSKTLALSACSGNSYTNQLKKVSKKCIKIKSTTQNQILNHSTDKLNDFVKINSKVYFANDPDDLT